MVRTSPKAVFYSHPLENQYQMQQLHGKPYPILTITILKPLLI